jgi:pyridoxal phosphate-dependent aminotransferase EpsN
MITKHESPTQKRLYLSPPDLDGREKQMLIDAFDSNWITTLGPHVEAFEREMCERLGIASAVALSSGTAGLHLALLILGIQRGDEVWCSDLTFVATVNAITYCGARPVFIDSDRATWNMDPQLLAEELHARRERGKLPRAVVVVDLYGQAADYAAILATCAEFGVPVIEDAAEALGATYMGKAAGSFGAMGVLSFNGNKIITTSGGGMLVSANKEYIDRARHLATQAREPFPYYHHTSIGYNYRLSNLLAAVGRAQLENLDRKVVRRRGIYAFYKHALGALPGIEFMPEAPDGIPNHWLTCVTIDPARLGARSEDIRLHLEASNIECRHIWKPMHMQPVFSECACIGGAVSEDLFSRGLCLPSGSGMSDADLERVVAGILECVGLGLIDQTTLRQQWSRRLIRSVAQPR